MKTQLINKIIADCLRYANHYNCTFEEALEDWEGDGPDGGWGLTQDERTEVQVIATRGKY
jgi:hypothetical protein